MAAMSRAHFTIWIGVVLSIKLTVERLLRSDPVTAFDWSNLLVPGLLPAGSQGDPVWGHPLVLGVIATGFALVLAEARLRDCGMSRFSLILLLVPYINMLYVVLLMFFPAREALPAETDDDELNPPPSGTLFLESSVMALAASVIFGIGSVVILASFGGHYGWTLFMGIPFVSSFLAVALQLKNRSTYLSWAGAMTIAFTTTALLGGLLVLFAIEGLICVLMYLPLAFFLAMLGASAAMSMKFMYQGGFTVRRAMVPFCVFLPMSLGLEQTNLPPLQEVTSSIEINAAPEAIWPYLLAFPSIPEPEQWMFRYGVAYPTKAWTDGAGVGAVRYCEFNHGTFVEPIEIWDPPHHLRFRVTEQPIPMKELSPYRNVHPPHLEGYFESERGEFVLIPLENGGTRVLGTTWYRHDMEPIRYWSWWTDYTIHQIHDRVLRHLKTVIEAAPGS
ncbi:SRPBCC family protein [Acanthopleuribacter pedis]|uniref:SRPBCC family protein n=1 Tax=Acanthopleuribacter pedis TaxID=442870 RepID=A0A8J7QEX4_9BACT|nr:SRPBCC family protein [Acanthopleuribacter pedis]MBO1322744.1 SRPBCC family protein [Acanthopleuribacter pedis]